MAVKSLNIKNVTVTLEAKRVKRVPGGKRFNKKLFTEQSSSTSGSRWKDIYEPLPLVSRSTILLLGFGFYVLAVLWAPLILVVAFFASMLVPYCFRENDNAETRRKLFNEFARELDLPLDFRRTPDDILLEESYWINQRGMCLYTHIMTPKNQPIQAVVCFCHGYTDQSSFVKRVEYQRLVRRGIAVVALDYEGHGRSDGALGLITDWDLLIDDTSMFFNQTVQEKFPDKKIFLMGESMGGAVAYSTYIRTPNTFCGVVFVSPMCKISDDMLPPTWVIDLMKWIVGSKGTNSLLGYLPLAPSRGDLRKYSIHLKEKEHLLCRPPTCFGRSPRLATARELLDITSQISSNLAEFDAPFLVQHGKQDRVTDPQLSVALYNESKSQDKAIRLYDDMWHTITSGEPDEYIEMVFNDAIDWILSRC